MSPAVATLDREPVRMRWKGKQSDAFKDTARELDIEGAVRASKTTICLWREHEACRRFPGIPIMLARWTEDAVYGLIVPLWNQICERAGDPQQWDAKESCYVWPHSGARIYIRGLKSQDQVLRYSKFRGLTLARIYIDQAEELPQDVYLECAARLSAPGYPHQITISPQAVEETHWIAKEFPADNRFAPNRAYYSLSAQDNAHNLDESVIPTLWRLYPPSHPKHKTLVLGQRGMNVTGDPVYKGAFMRALHEAAAEFDRDLPLEVALDFGKHHPCMVARQVSNLGQRRFLGGILGQQLYLDDFLDVVLRHLGSWFPGAQIQWCCDPAGTVDTSHGTHGAYKTLRAKGIVCRSLPDSNSPAMRLAAVERMAAQMRKRAADRAEAFIVSNSERWLRVSEENTVIDRFLADGFEAGYVWDEHMVSVNNKQVRKPKKDGWYEHGQNCAEYLELNFSGVIRKDEPAPVVTYKPKGKFG